MNDDCDLYYTDERQSEKLIADCELDMSNETIANRAFNEGFFTTCSVVNQDKYKEGFQVGKQYSINFGKLLGVIDAFLFYAQEINHDDNTKYKLIDHNDLNKIKDIKGYLEQYKEEINNEFIEEKQNEIMSITNKYI